jgi:hypothetical protein
VCVCVCGGVASVLGGPVGSVCQVQQGPFVLDLGRDLGVVGHAGVVWLCFTERLHERACQQGTASTRRGCAAPSVVLYAVVWCNCQPCKVWEVCVVEG